MDVADKIAVGDKIQRIDISRSHGFPAAHARRPPPTPNAPVLRAGPARWPSSSWQSADGLYNAAPAMTIDPAKTYQATIETDKGNIVVELDPKSAPATVNNFVTAGQPGLLRRDAGRPRAGRHLCRDRFADKRPDSDVGYTLPAGTGASQPAGHHRHRRHVPSADPATGERRPAAASSSSRSSRPPRTTPRSTSSARWSRAWTS